MHLMCCVQKCANMLLTASVCGEKITYGLKDTGLLIAVNYSTCNNYTHTHTHIPTIQTLDHHASPNKCGLLFLVIQIFKSYIFLIGHFTLNIANGFIVNCFQRKCQVGPSMYYKYLYPLFFPFECLTAVCFFKN